MRIAFGRAKVHTVAVQAALSLALLVSGCSSQQQQQQQGDEDLEVTNEQGDGSDFGGDDAAGSNDSGMEQTNSQEEGLDGANINSETASDTEGMDAPVDASLNGMATNAANPADMPPTNAAPMPENPAPIANAAAAAPAAAPAAPVASDQAPIPGGRVRYVPEGGVQVVNAPGGSPVTTLEQGEHPVTWEENGWLKLANGYFVPADGLSNSGVGRPATGNAWK